jgi:hypothetical protein
MEQRVTRLEEWRTGIDARMKTLEHVLFGNGQPGVIDRMRIGDEEGRETRRILNDMIRTSEDRARFHKQVLGGLISGLVLLVLNLLVSFLK